MSKNPYYIEGPAIVSFSGGRTSGFMLRQILDAHGGIMPKDVRVVFYNTGLEHERTYEFVREVGSRWWPIVWLEYRNEPRDGGLTHTFDIVTFETASREGEPFTALINARKYLPNPVTRFCTAELKVRTGQRYAKSLDWKVYTNAVGLRADEPRRVARMKGDIAAEDVVMPMAQAGHTKPDVLRFWALQAFDLMLPNDDPAYGNCVGCFLKARHKLERIMEQEPEQFDWWAAQEASGRTDQQGRPAIFRIDRPTYRQMLTQVTVQGRIFEQVDDDTIPCMCTE